MSETLLRKLLSEMKHVNKRLANVEANISGVKTEMKSEFSSIKIEMTGMKSDIFGIKTEMANINKRLGAVESDLKQLTQAVLETNEHFKKLAYIQDSQHKIIDLLSVRSIEQEAILKQMNEPQTITSTL